MGQQVLGKHVVVCGTLEFIAFELILAGYAYYRGYKYGRRDERMQSYDEHHRKESDKKNEK